MRFLSERARAGRSRRSARFQVLYVADTGNHRIRKITGAGTSGSTTVKVACFAGRCGNGTHTYADSLQAAAPEPGLADGAGLCRNQIFNPTSM